PSACPASSPAPSRPTSTTAATPARPPRRSASTARPSTTASAAPSTSPASTSPTASNASSSTSASRPRRSSTTEARPRAAALERSAGGPCRTPGFRLRGITATLGVMPEFDLVVLGSGPGGQKAAIAAAKLGRRVAIVERRDMIGGVSVNTGTIPSKTLREAVLFLTGLHQRELYGQSYRVKEEITISDLMTRTRHVIGREVDVIRSQLLRNRVTLLHGTGRFLDPHTIGVVDEFGRETKVTAEKIIIATGTRPARPDSVEFDGRTIIDS